MYLCIGLGILGAENSMSVWADMRWGRREGRTRDKYDTVTLICRV